MAKKKSNGRKKEEDVLKEVETIKEILSEADREKDIEEKAESVESEERIRAVADLSAFKESAGESGAGAFVPEPETTMAGRRQRSAGVAQTQSAGEDRYVARTGGLEVAERAYTASVEASAGAAVESGRQVMATRSTFGDSRVMAGRGGRVVTQRGEELAGEREYQEKEKKKKDKLPWE
jgi:hypothetical protein